MLIISFPWHTYIFTSKNSNYVDIFSLPFHLQILFIPTSMHLCQWYVNKFDNGIVWTGFMLLTTVLTNLSVEGKIYHFARWTQIPVRKYIPYTNPQYTLCIYNLFVSRSWHTHCQGYLSRLSCTEQHFDYKFEIWLGARYLLDCVAAILAVGQEKRSRWLRG